MGAQEGHLFKPEYLVGWVFRDIFLHKVIPEKINGIYPEGRGGDCRRRVDRESHFRETGTTAIRLCF